MWARFKQFYGILKDVVKNAIEQNSGHGLNLAHKTQTERTRRKIFLLIFLFERPLFYTESIACKDRKDTERIKFEVKSIAMNDRKDRKDSYISFIKRERKEYKI